MNKDDKHFTGLGALLYLVIIVSGAIGLFIAIDYFSNENNVISLIILLRIFSPYIIIVLLLIIIIILLVKKKK